MRQRGGTDALAPANSARQRGGTDALAPASTVRQNRNVPRPGRQNAPGAVPSTAS